MEKTHYAITNDSIWIDGSSLVNSSYIARLWIPEICRLVYAASELFHFHFVLRLLSKNLLQKIGGHGKWSKNRIE